MGVDLILFPVDYENNGGGSSFSRLMLERRRELWDDITALESHSFGRLTGYLRNNFGTEIDDCYGDRLKFVFAKDFALLAKHPAVQDNDANRAIWAYLAALNPETKIVLYWS